MLSAHILSLLTMRVCSMGAGYSTSDAELPGFTLAAPILNIRPAFSPDDPESSERMAQAAFDSVKQEADRRLAELLKTYEAPLHQFLAGRHGYTRWAHLIATQGGFCSQPLLLDDGEIGIHFNTGVPAVVEAVVAVQVAAHLARTTPSSAPVLVRWSPRAALVDELGRNLGGWPGISVGELAHAALMRDKLEALAAEPLATKPGEATWSLAVREDLARTKAKVLVAYLAGKVVGDDLLRAMSRFRYEDEEALFVLVAGLATDAVWKAQKTKLAAAIAQEIKRIDPATSMRELRRHVLAGGVSR
jgi:hypothetical protein